MAGKMKSTPNFQRILRKANTYPIILTVVYVSFITLISGMFYSLIPQLIEEIKGIIKLAPQITFQLQSASDSLQSQVSFDLGLDEAFNTLVSKTNIETTARTIFENLKEAGVFLVKILIALILSYIFLIDKKKIQSFFGSVKQGNFSFIYEQFSLFFEKITKSFGLLFKAQALIALANAALTTLWLLLISFIQWDEVFPFIVTLSVIVFILGFIPVFGFLISSAPILLIGFNYGWMPVVYGIMAMIAIVHAVEAYYLNPKIVSSYMDFPVFITFMVLLMSEHFFGFIGLLIGVPLFYIVIDILKDINEYIEKIKLISSSFETQKASTRDSIDAGIRLSRSWKRSMEE
jgi:predicted PurR-regulated permease PerM